MPGIIGFSGSLGHPSRTCALVEAATGAVARGRDEPGLVFSLRDLGPSLGAAAALHELAPEARGVLDLLVQADALVVGTPVYKGGCAGLFKHVFDLLDPEALRGMPVLLVATGGGERHALVIEHQLRPLFGFFEAATVPTGVYASAADFRDGRPASPALLARLETATGQLSAALRRQGAAGRASLAITAA